MSSLRRIGLVTTMAVVLLHVFGVIPLGEIEFVSILLLMLFLAGSPRRSGEASGTVPQEKPPEAPPRRGEDMSNIGSCYFDRQDGKRQWSLRSDENGLDVSEIARQMGGGGHPRAAGFEEDVR